MHLPYLVPPDPALMPELGPAELPDMRMMIITKGIHQLKQHPENLRLHGPVGNTDDLEESIDRLGHVSQFFITNRNYELLTSTCLANAAKALGFLMVDIVMLSDLTPEQELEIIISLNKQRQKSSEHTAKELESLTEILARERSVDGKVRDEVTRRTGINGANISKYKQIKESDRAEELFRRMDLPQGDPDRLSLHRAYLLVKAPSVPKPMSAVQIPRVESAERVIVQVIEQPVEQGILQVIEQSVEQVIEKTAEKPAEQGILQVIKQPGEQAVKQPLPQVVSPDFELKYCPCCLRPY